MYELNCGNVQSLLCVLHLAIHICGNVARNGNCFMHVEKENQMSYEGKMSCIFELQAQMFFSNYDFDFNTGQNLDAME